MTSLSSIITDAKREALTQDLSASGFPEAADIINKLMVFVRDEIYLLDDLDRAARNFLSAEKVVHRMYPNTNTCRSRPGLIAGQAFTHHCSHSCSNPEHADERREYIAARDALSNAIGAVRG